MIVLSLISLGYQAVADNPIIAAAFSRMRAVVAAIVLQVSWRSSSPWQKKAVLPIALFILSFVALFIFKINIMLVMIAIILFSVIHSLAVMKEERK